MNTLTNSVLTANNNLEAFWEFVITSFSKELSPQQFKTWIKPLFAIGFNDTDNVLSLAAPNRFKLDWAKNQFNQRFIELSQNYYGRPVTVEWVLDPKVKLVNTGNAPSEFLVETFENSNNSQSIDFNDAPVELPSIGIDGRSV